MEESQLIMQAGAAGISFHTLIAIGKRSVMVGGYRPLSLAKPLFRAETSSHKCKNIFLVSIKRKNAIRSVQRDEVPEIRIFTNNINCVE